jgi:hypothetical protein
MMWLGIVQKGRILEIRRRRERRNKTQSLKKSRRVVGTCSRKLLILFWYSKNFKCCFGFFFNKTWNYAIILKDVFNITEKHTLQQWSVCFSVILKTSFKIICSMFIFCVNFLMKWIIILFLEVFTMYSEV